MGDSANIAVRRYSRAIREILLQCEDALKKKSSVAHASSSWSDIMSGLSNLNDSRLAKRLSLIAPSNGSVDSYMAAIGMVRREIMSWLNNDFAEIINAMSRVAVFTKTGGSQQHYPNLSKGASVAKKDMNADLAIAGDDLSEFESKFTSSVNDEAEPKDTIEEIRKMDQLNDVFIDNLSLTSKTGFSLISRGCLDESTGPGNFYAEPFRDGIVLFADPDVVAPVNASEVWAAAEGTARLKSEKFGFCLFESTTTNTGLNVDMLVFPKTGYYRLRVRKESFYGRYVVGTTVHTAVVAGGAVKTAADTDLVATLQVRVGGVLQAQFSGTDADTVPNLWRELVVYASAGDVLNLGLDSDGANKTGCAGWTIIAQDEPIDDSHEDLDDIFSSNSLYVSKSHLCEAAIKDLTDYDDYRISAWGHDSMFDVVMTNLTTASGGLDAGVTYKVIRDPTWWFSYNWSQFSTAQLKDIKSVYQGQYLPMLRLLSTMVKADIVWLTDRYSSH